MTATPLIISSERRRLPKGVDYHIVTEETATADLIIDLTDMDDEPPDDLWLIIPRVFEVRHGR